MTALAPESRPRLLRGVRLKEDKARGRHVILAPERVIEADAIAVAIVSRCDGRTLTALIDDLASTYKAPRDRIETDVMVLLQSLIGKGLMSVEAAA